MINLPRSFEDIKSLLRLRLYRSAHFNLASPDQFMGREVAKDLLAVPLFSLPEGLVMVRPSLVEEWPLSQEEVFRLALRQTRTSGPPTQIPQELTPGLILHTTMGDDPCLATQALFHGQGLPKDRGHGLLVTLPHHQMTFSHVVEDARFSAAIDGLMALTQRLASNDLLSPHIFWRREDEPLIPLTAWKEGQLHVDLPLEFREKVVRRFSM